MIGQAMVIFSHLCIDKLTKLCKNLINLYQLDQLGLGWQWPVGRGQPKQVMGYTKLGGGGGEPPANPIPSACTYDVFCFHSLIVVLT